MKRPAFIYLSLCGLLVVAGCASVPNEVTHLASDVARQSIGEPVVVTTATADARSSAASDLLGKPLTQNDAIRLALSHSPAFQTVLAEAHLQAVTATQAGRLPNPVFTFERLVRKEHGGVDLDLGRMLSASLLEFLTWPQRQELKQALLEEARLKLASELVGTVAATREAWVRAVAAEQALQYHQQVKDAADASAELARRMYTVGNFSRLQRARQQAFYADAAAQLVKAEQIAVTTREALVRVLGLDESLASKLVLPSRLPDLPASLPLPTSTAQVAAQQRLDIRLGQSRLQTVAARNQLGRAASYINVLHLAGVRNSETGKPSQKGFELEVSVPVFDWGDAARGRARAEYDQAVFALAQTTVEAQSMLREQLAAHRAAYQLAQHYQQEIMPLRQVIADETLLKYNGMLTGVFDLLAETRAQIGSVIQTLEAQRDFWLAEASLQATVLGRPLASPKFAASAAAAAAPAGH